MKEKDRNSDKKFPLKTIVSNGLIVQLSRNKSFYRYIYFKMSFFFFYSTWYWVGHEYKPIRLSRKKFDKNRTNFKWINIYINFDFIDLLLLISASYWLKSHNLKWKYHLKQIVVQTTILLNTNCIQRNLIIVIKLLLR